jgi:molybdenum cofactor cytidylyltransferase
VRFDEVPVAEAVGAILAHSHRTGPVAMLKKGHLVGVADARALEAAGVKAVWAVRLDPTDRHEDEAARRVASALTGASPANLRVDAAATGRVNVFAAARGVFVGSRARIDAVNAVDESITLATVPPYAVVEEGVMVATVKVIPFAVPESVIVRACEAASITATADAGPLLGVAPFVRRRVGLVLTTLPGVHNTTLDRAGKNQRLRLASLGSKLTRELRVRHDAPAVASAIETLLAEGMDMVLVLGASAIIDRRDVVPRAVEAVSGVVDQLGMPVDPGNLILVGHVEREGKRTAIVGVPGCARSLKPSGFDWVLERLVAGLPVGRAELSTLGAGGLLVDIPTRPSPRARAERDAEESAVAAPPRVAAIVLAAGLSRRMGDTNKLLAEVDGQPIVRRVVDTLLASKARPILVVVGHQEEQVRAALAGRAVRFVTNRAYKEGLGASLRTGIEALGIMTRKPNEIDGTLVALGDMPWIKASHIDALIDAFDPTSAASICVPVHDRKRGHPVLWSSRHFGEMRKLQGDVGARALLEAHADSVLAVPVDDPAVHLDIDTPEMLAAARAV